MTGTEKEFKRVEHDGYLGVHSELWPRPLVSQIVLVDLEAVSYKALLLLRQRPKLHGEIHDWHGQVSTQSILSLLISQRRRRGTQSESHTFSIAFLDWMTGRSHGPEARSPAQSAFST